MPAVNVADWTVLPRVIAAPMQTEDRAPVTVTGARSSVCVGAAITRGRTVQSATFTAGI